MLIFDCGYGVASLSFTRDGTRLIVEPSVEGPLELWTLATGERVQLPDPWRGLCRSPVVHPVGQFVYTGGRHFTSIRLADRSAWSDERSGRVERVAISPTGDRVVAQSSITSANFISYRCGADGSASDAWEWFAKPHYAYIQEELCGFVGAGDRLVSVGGKSFVVRDAATGNVLAAVPYPSHTARCPTVSRDGRRLAVMGYEHLYIWDTTAWGKPARFEANSSRQFVSLALHPARPLLAGVQRGQTLVKFLDADTGKIVTKFQWKLGQMRCVAFSSDGTLAAAGSESGKIVVWDVDE